MFLLCFESESNSNQTSHVRGQSNFKIIFQEDERIEPGTAATCCLKPVGFHRVCFLDEANPLVHIKPSQIEVFL